VTRGGAAALGLLVAAVLLWPVQGLGQSVADRTPNLADGWVGQTGELRFHFLHRFWLARSPGEDKLVNSPTLLLAAPLPARSLLGVQYASNALVSGGNFNEWEPFFRIAVLQASDRRPGVALTAAYNSAAGSGDGEAVIALPIGRFRALGAARVFSDAVGSGDSGVALVGGGVLRLRDNVFLSGDLASLWIDGDREPNAWGAGLQLRVPFSPHSLSLQATNTRTASLQGSSVGGSRTVWGFEFTVPITPSRYIPALRSGS
jgi:hypothetical protein